MSVMILGAKSRQLSRSLGSTRCRNGRLFVTQKPRLRPPALAFANHRPGQKPTQAKVVGPAWPGFFWPGLARLLASSRSRHITNCIILLSHFDLSLCRNAPSALFGAFSAEFKSSKQCLFNVPRPKLNDLCVHKQSSHWLDLDPWASIPRLHLQKPTDFDVLALV